MKKLSVTGTDLMTWEAKFYAIKSLARESVLEMRKPGDWYVSDGIEVKTRGECMLEGRYGNGSTPEEAVLDHWNQLVTSLTSNQYLVVHASGKERRAARWNGYMWEKVTE